MNREPDRMSSESESVDLLAKALECLDQGGESALQALLDGHPQEATGIREKLKRLHGVGLVGPGTGEVPERMGEFVLRRRLGGGGMGVVYLAEQPSLGREVALKLIKPELLYFPNARERFLREVQAIARLQHPGIVRVYSAGQEKGLPYFTMEPVDGIPLSRLLEALGDRSPTRLNQRALLEVLGTLASDRSPTLPGSPRTSWTDICLRWVRELTVALSYAHSQGVLHRDLKPSNIMLSWDGRLVLLDFGLASTQDTSRLTRSGSQIGSLPYMAPEQLRGELERIDQRTDTYALGVMLYELLTLRHPYLDPSSNLEELRGTILSAAPPPMRTLNPALPWDVETVCLTAMDPDPDRRYASMDALGRDADCILQRRPIEARRPGPLLRVRRLAQRHPAATVGAILGFLLFVVALPAFLVREVVHGQALAAAKLDAEREADIANETLRFLNEDLLGAVAPEKLGKDISMRQVLDVASRRVEGRFADRPRVEARIRYAIANTYRKLGVLRTAEPHMTRAHDLLREQNQLEDQFTLRVANTLAVLLRESGQYEEARALYLQTLEIRRRTLGPEDNETLTTMNNLGLLYLDMGRFEDAEPLLQGVLTARQRLLGDEHENTLVSMSNLALLYYRNLDYAQALMWGQQELEICRRVLGEEHPDTVISMNNVANTLQGMGRFKESLALQEKALEISERVLGDSHPETINLMLNLGGSLLNDGDAAGAGELYLRAQDRVETLPERHPHRINVPHRLAILFLHQRRYAEAEALIGPALEGALDLWGEGDARTLEIMLTYADLLERLGETEEAQEMRQEVRAYRDEFESKATQPSR